MGHHQKSGQALECHSSWPGMQPIKACPVEKPPAEPESQQPMADAKRNGYTALADAPEAPKANIAVLGLLVFNVSNVKGFKSGCGYGLFLVGQADAMALLCCLWCPALVPQGQPADSREPVQMEKVHDRIQACHTGPEFVQRAMPCPSHGRFPPCLPPCGGFLRCWFPTIGVLPNHLF